MKNISVCAIARDEEQNIEKMLKSVSKYGFEIVVVDTGSKDRTKEIALKYTDKVYDFEWINDFSAAKNYAADMSTNDWIIGIDSDEWIEEIDLEELELLIENNKDALGSIWMDNLVGSPDHVTGVSRCHLERIYNRQYFEYRNPIHERLCPKQEKEFENFQMNVVFGHSGYCLDEATRKKKGKRNLELLLEEHTKKPTDPYTIYQIGKSYGLFSDYENSYKYYSRALEFDLDPRLDYVWDLVVEYGKALMILEKYDEALELQGVYEEFKYAADFTYLMGLVYLHFDKYQEAYEAFIDAAKSDIYHQEGINTYLPRYEIAKIMIKAGEFDTAKEFLKNCFGYPLALELLKEIEDK